MWLALYGSRRQLLIELGATVATLLLPWALIGGDQYPASTPRSALLILTVAAIAGLSIQRLLGEVRANRDRLSGVLSAATGNAIVATDLSGTITVFNAGAESMLGYRAEEVVGRATPALFLAAEELALHAAALGIEPTFEAFTAHTAAAGSATRELTYVRKDRTRLRVSQTLTVERDAGGRVVGFLGVATDVTEQVRAQAALVEERDFTDAVLDTAGSLVIVTDRDARIERFNRAAEEVTGFAAADMIGRSLIDTLIPPESAEAVRAELAAAVAAEFPRHYEHGLLTAGGGRRMVSWDVTCLVDDAGAITHLVATGTDVTEQRRAAEALRISTEWLEGILEHTTTRITVKDDEGRYLLVNRAWRGGERRRCDRPDGRRAVRPRGHRAGAPDRPGGVGHGPHGRVRADDRRVDRAGGQVPAARRGGRDLRRRVGRDGHLRAQPRPGRGARGVRGEVGLRGQHEPRDPDAAQRRDRDARAARGHVAERRAALAGRDGRLVRRRAAGRRQRRAGLLEDRGGQARARAARLRPA